MKNTSIALLSMALLSAPLAMAQYQLVNNFDSGSLTGVTAGFSPAEDNMNGGISIISDPDNAGAGLLKLDPGTFSTIDGIGTHNVWFSMLMPDIATKGTVYFKFKREGLADIVFGTAAVEPAAYGDYSALFRTEIDGIFDYHDGSYTETSVVNDQDVWYEAWIVVDVTANTYDAYVKGGALTTQTQICAGADMRANTVDPQKYFSARFSTGDATNPKGDSPVLFDDVFVDPTAENLATPGDDVVITDPGEVPTQNGSGELSNLSTRGSVSTGENAMFVGFVATEDSRRFLIRGAGPLLADFGVTAALTNPVITVRTASATPTVVATNTNWGDNSNAASIALTAAAVGAQPFASGSADAALMLFLAPGGYTVEISSGDGSTGVALAEVYRIP